MRRVMIYFLLVIVLGFYYNDMIDIPLWQRYFPIKVMALVMENIFSSIYLGLWSFGLIDNVKKNLIKSMGIMFLGMIFLKIIQAMTGENLWFLFY